MTRAPPKGYHLTMSPFRSKEFRAYFLNIAAQAEDSDEGMFSEIAKAVPEDLRESVLRHAEEEKHHAWMLRGAVLRNGGNPWPVPPELQFFNLLLEASGIKSPADELMAFFCLLQVAEERAVEQYSALSLILEEIDPETAKAFVDIVADEVGHIFHCEKLARRFASNEDALRSTLDRMRRIEEEVFEKFTASVFEGAP